MSFDANTDRTSAIGRAMIAGASVALACLGCAGSADETAASERLGVAEEAIGAGTYEEVSGFGSNPGGLKMFRYVPSPAPSGPAPLVLAMHACSQDATAYRASGWEEMADTYGFYVVYPEQQTANNALRCFNWAGEYGDATNLARGKGENQSIKEMVDKMSADFAVDAAKVFAVGHSGGGAQAALLMATWPDVFAGAGIMAGIPYKCTTQYFEVSSCLSPGKELSAEEWGKRAREGYPGYAGPWPRLSIWHGTADTLVAPKNLTELVEQWSNVHGIAAAPTASDMVAGYPHDQFTNSDGMAVIETYQITGANHGTFVDPDSGCGATGAYFLDHDICAARHMSEFFGIVGSSSTSSSGASASGAASGASGATGGESSGSGGEEDTACVPGREKPCECEGGGESFKTCNDEGTRYSECDCPSVIRDSSDCSVGAGRGGASSAPWALFGLAWMWALSRGLVRARRGSGGGAAR